MIVYLFNLIFFYFFYNFANLLLIFIFLLLCTNLFCSFIKIIACKLNLKYNCIQIL